VESTTFSVLVLTAFGLLIAVSGGVVYLTLADWRDRRRREQEKQQDKQQAKRRR
jgi:biopolymer transport protein ExbB/TolQ